MERFVIIIYSKKPSFKKGDIKQSILDNSPINKDLVNTLRDLYGAMKYNTATTSLFGDSNTTPKKNIK